MTSGITSGDDYVAARLSVDIPEGSSAAVNDLTQALERFHVTMEAAVRAEADGGRYLDQMAEATRRASEALQTYNQEMQMSLSLQARGTGFSTGVPGGTAQMPFQGIQAGTGGARVPSPSDVAYQVNNAASGHQQEYLNMQAARGRMSGADLTSLTPESISELANKIAQREVQAREQANKTDGNVDSKTPPSGQGTGDTGGGSIGERIGRAAGLAGEVMNEVGPGGSMMGMGNLAMRGIAAARRRSSAAPGRGTPSGGESTGPAVASDGEPGTGGDVAPESEGLTGILGGVTKMLGPLGIAVTGAMAAFGLVEKGGSMIQGARNVASVRGGAAGEGFDVEAKARILSMNPFITQDQARQIYQGVMSEGYADASGGGADNVIDFMTHNLTSMNISVADSAKMLRSTIVGSGSGDKDSVNSAVQSLGKELDTIRTLSREGVMSTPDFRAGVMKSQQALMDAGGSPEQAMSSAMTAEMVGSDDQVTKGQFGRIAASMSSDQNGMWLRNFGGPGGTPLRGVPGNLLPQVTAEYLQDQGGDAYNRAVLGVEQGAARQASQIQGPEENQVYIFQQRLKQMGLDTDATTSRPMAKRIFEDIRDGKEEDALSAAEQSTQKQGVSSSGRGGSQQTNVSGSVQIGLTPDAQKLLQVMGGNTTKLTATQIGSNQGLAGYQLNARAPGEN
jgi:hypothetical protein